MAALVRPTLCPFTTRPAARRSSICSNWIAYASSRVRSSYVEVSGAIGLPVPYASSSCRATSDRVIWSTGPPRRGERGGRRSQLQLEPGTGRPGDADQHPVHGCPLLLGEHQIAVID